MLQIPEDYWRDIAISPQILNRKALEDIKALSDPHLQGRRAGTAGETLALVYLEGQAKDLHLFAFGENKNYWQMFSIPSMAEKIINNRALFRPDETDHLLNPAANMLAGIVGKNPEKTVIISAHYDHLGVYMGKLYPGANDNASGVGCVLEVMRRLVADALGGYRPEINIVAAFWGAEEMGFLGSEHFVKKPTIPLSNIHAVINCDTVANGQKDDFSLWADQDNFLVKAMQKAAGNYGVDIKNVSGEGHHSDEISFAAAGVPAVTLLSKEWLDKNHTPKDDLSLINSDKLDFACQLVYDLIKQLAN